MRPYLVTWHTYPCNFYENHSISDTDGLYHVPVRIRLASSHWSVPPKIRFDSFPSVTIVILVCPTSFVVPPLAIAPPMSVSRHHVPFFCYDYCYQISYSVLCSPIPNDGIDSMRKPLGPNPKWHHHIASSL